LSGFHQLESGAPHPVLKHISDTIAMGVYMVTLPWLHCLLGAIPSFGIIYQPDGDFRGFAKHALEMRLKAQELQRQDGDEEKHESQQLRDVMSYLMAPSAPSQKTQDVILTEHEITSDALLLILAGSDTTTSAAIHALYRLARHPHLQTMLLSSITESLGPEALKEPLTAAQVARLPYLEALVTEVLRLHPSAVTGLPRVVPSQGLALEDGTLIPPRTQVSSPVYSLHRDPRNFPSPLDFLPERWLPKATTAGCPDGAQPKPKPELVKDRRAFLAFGTGPYGCPGKKMAYVELKMLLANVVRRFEVGFAEGVDVAAVSEGIEAAWKDHVVVQAARVELRFVSRDKLMG